MAKEKKSMIPGKRYRGYGFINEFKEFCFEPEDTGSRAGAIKQICCKDGISVSETRENLIIHIKMPKCSNILERLKEAARMYNSLTKIIQDYDI